MRYIVIILTILLLGANSAFSDAPTWPVLTGLLNNMILYGHIKIDGINVADGNILAAFGPGGDTDVRSKVTIADQSGALNYYMIIGGDYYGEEIRFKIYVHSEDRIYDVDETIYFDPDNTVMKELNIFNKTQIISALMNDNHNPIVGDEFNVTINYDVSNNSNLSGIGVNIHYDSSKLEYIECNNIFKKNINEPKLNDDNENNDENSTTDKLVNISWYDADNSWPATILPLDLAQLKFIALSEGESKINITFSHSAYIAKAKNLSIEILPINNLEQLYNTITILKELEINQRLGIFDIDKNYIVGLPDVIHMMYFLANKY